MSCVIGVFSKPSGNHLVVPILFLFIELETSNCLFFGLENTRLNFPLLYFSVLIRLFKELDMVNFLYKVWPQHAVSWNQLGSKKQK